MNQENQRLAELIQELLKNEEKYCFLLAALISADSNLTNEERQRNMETMRMILQALPEIKTENALEKERLERMESILHEGISLLEEEMKDEQEL